MVGCEIVAVQEVIQKTDAIEEFAALAKKKDLEEYISISLEKETIDHLLPLVVEQSIACYEKDANSAEITALVKERLSNPIYIEQLVSSFSEALTHKEIKTLLDFHSLLKTEHKSLFCFPVYQICSTAIAEILEPYPTLLPPSEPLSVIQVTKETFRQEVLESTIPVLVDAYGDFCPPCKQVAPIFAELAHEMYGKVKFVKFSTNQEQDLAQELEIRSVPTFLFVKDGKMVERRVGFRDKNALTLELLKTFL